MTDAHPKLGPRNWKVDLGRAALGGVGAVAALSVAQWPSNAAEAAWAGVAGLILGLVVAFGVEYLVRLHIAVRRLGTLERQLAVETEARIEERKLHVRLLLIERRRVAVAEVDIEIWGGHTTRQLRPDMSCLFQRSWRDGRSRLKHGISTCRCLPKPDPWIAQQDLFCCLRKRSALPAVAAPLSNTLLNTLFEVYQRAHTLSPKRLNELRREWEHTR